MLSIIQAATQSQNVIISELKVNCNAPWQSISSYKRNTSFCNGVKGLRLFDSNPCRVFRGSLMDISTVRLLIFFFRPEKLFIIDMPKVGENVFWIKEQKMSIAFPHCWQSMRDPLNSPFTTTNFSEMQHFYHMSCSLSSRPFREYNWVSFFRFLWKKQRSNGNNRLCLRNVVFGAK